MSQLGQYPPKNPRNKPLIISLLITGFLVLGFVGGGLWAFQKLTDNGKEEEETSPPPTSETYSNSRFGIALSYPPSWELRKERQDYPPSALTGQKNLFQLLAPNQGNGEYRENIVVKIEQVEKTPFLDTYTNGQKLRITQLGTFEVESNQRMTMDGQDVREIVYSGNNGEYDLKRKRIIALPKTPSVPPYVILITYTADVEDYDKYLPDTEQILQSIKLD
ncbi:PsbP-related protein [Crocosphaera sp.]|uniref:PsbP-related protein n=1 Tax=Crocosphaera sp. TaxID=2729996 RepID=UPI00261A389A|nr:PsbP-related protein [Crocosphaera sp.]MDJ0581644.1 PsbP-related protein [Crocosphaera sp.]